jgi:hypothetical protein
MATPKMAARARRCEIYKARRFSDHAPLLGAAVAPPSERAWGIKRHLQII